MMNTVTFTPYLSKSPYAVTSLYTTSRRTMMGQGPQSATAASQSEPGFIGQVKNLWTTERPWINTTAPRFGLDLII